MSPWVNFFVVPYDNSILEPPLPYTAGKVSVDKLILRLLRWEIFLYFLAGPPMLSQNWIKEKQEGGMNGNREAFEGTGLLALKMEDGDCESRTTVLGNRKRKKDISSPPPPASEGHCLLDILPKSSFILLASRMLEE